MSVPDLHTRAAHFFLLAEQVSRLELSQRRLFWHGAALRVQEPAAHLPALVNAVHREYDSEVLRGLAAYPLPVRLSPGTVPWHDDLVATWEVRCASDYPDQSHIGLLAQVRLDGCGMPEGMTRPSRLPEWLAEARRIVGAGYEPARTEPARTEPARTGESRMEKLKALAALAAWRPAPGVITPPETLRDWVAFWERGYRSRSALMRGIAARALLNLPETNLRAASIRPVPPEQRLRDLTEAIAAAAERTTRTLDYSYLLMLDWQPVEETVGPVAEAMEVARAWLKVTLHNNSWCRRMAWRQLIRWDRAEILTDWGIDLLPYVERAVQMGKDGGVLWELAHWMSGARLSGTVRPASNSFLFQQLKTYWQVHRQSWDWQNRASGWLAGIRLHEAGLAFAPPEVFLRDYLSAVMDESWDQTLFVLAQWSPGTEAPATFHREWQHCWQHRLTDEKKEIRQIAGYALLRQALEKEDAKALRRAALETWRTGTKEAPAASRRLGAVLSRFHELRAQLATGTVPHFAFIPPSPAEKQRPQLALPPGHIADGEWKIGNGRCRIAWADATSAQAWHSPRLANG